METAEDDAYWFYLDPTDFNSEDDYCDDRDDPDNIRDIIPDMEDQ